VLGITGADVYSTAYDSPANTAFLKAWSDAYPNRAVSSTVAQGYAGAQVIQSALEKVGGSLQDKQKFLEALSSTSADTVKGPVKLDGNRDVISNVYLWQMVKGSPRPAQQLAKTYDAVSSSWDRTADEIAHFPFGQNKNKWVGMTKDKLATLSK